ncbi:MAG: aconitate hydratase B, partial [Proteobacteria bacterium]|nr:aconitate hydratase B [Pseudomonadota bacterium]
MIETYLSQLVEREKHGIPALPLSPEQTKELCQLLMTPPDDKGEFLLDLISNRVSPGVDPAAQIKAEFLAQIAFSELRSPLIPPENAVKLLGTMVGGYNLPPLVKLLEDPKLGNLAADALCDIILIADMFDEVLALSKSNENAKRVLQSWADADWFTSKPALPEIIEGVVYKVDGEINTDDFSPASEAWSRPDIPLHALSMGQTRFPDGLDKIKEFQSDGEQVIFVGDVVGTGSSRKSACNSVLWYIGDAIPFIPNKKKGGVILGGQIAPIFYNTAEDSGALPIRCDVSKLNTGDKIRINTLKGNLTNAKGEELAKIDISASMADEVKAGGRVPLIIGQTLTEKARKALGLGEDQVFVKAAKLDEHKGGYTLAQKMVGQACGEKGVLPGTNCFPKMTTVGSQDTTGPMTRDEMMELACLG